jgi:hypothetical protein
MSEQPVITAPSFGYGIGGIAVEMFREDTPTTRRRVSRLIYDVDPEERLKTFLLAGVRCALCSDIRAYIETRAAAGGLPRIRCRGRGRPRKLRVLLKPPPREAATTNL